MTTRQTRTAAAWTPPSRPQTLEEIGIDSGSGWVPSGEEQARLDALEAERLARANANLDARLAVFWACQVCGELAGESDGLCGHCRVVVRRLQVERYCAEEVNGVSRAELADAFLARQAQP
jgi:hypothetical protein